MHALQNAGIRLEVEGDALRIIDRGRDCIWRADLRQGHDAAPVVSLQQDRLAVEYPGAGAKLRYVWGLAEDHVCVGLTVSGEMGRAMMAPRFAPAGERAQAVIPQYQGALLRGGGEVWSAEAVRGGHTNLSMGMMGLFGGRGGLLLVPDRLVGWIARFGNDGAGPWAAFDAAALAGEGEGEGWREMTIRLYPCERGVGGIAGRYRRIVKSRGQWVSWSEKIAAKPSLERLFGSLLAFIGYVQDEAVDYVGDVRRLRGYGFDRVMVYPARFAHYTPFSMAGGHPPIHLSDGQIAEMKELGALVAPWAWTYEGKDDGSEAMRNIFRHGPEGPARGWAMDGQQWYHICPPEQSRHMAGRLKSDMAAMDWLHFDVNATHPAVACWSKEHALHPGHPLTLEQGIAETGRLLGARTVGDRIVSSEGFNDAYTNTYDIGSTKMVPLDVPKLSAVPIPLTMLVYHDCCLHDWWELHNYNANPCWKLGSGHTGSSHLGRAGSGEPRLKAAMDALSGLPPNVFPFGMQYGWVSGPGGQTYPFRMRLEDAAVQEALAAALPVAKLHREIGKLEMTGFELVDDRLLLQRSTFADGTQITANLDGRAADLAGGKLPGHGWRRARV